MKMNIKAEDLVNEVAAKLVKFDEASKKLYGLGQKKIRNRFISKCLLDYYLTKISPMQLAEYREARNELI